MLEYTFVYSHCLRKFRCCLQQKQQSHNIEYLESYIDLKITLCTIIHPYIHCYSHLRLYLAQINIYLALIATLEPLDMKEKRITSLSSLMELNRSFVIKFPRCNNKTTLYGFMAFRFSLFDLFEPGKN